MLDYTFQAPRAEEAAVMPYFGAMEARGSGCGSTRVEFGGARAKKQNS